MWVKKSDEELKNEQNKRFKPSFVAPFIFFLGSVIVMSLPKMIGMSRSIHGEKPIGIIKFIPLLPKVIFISIGIAFLVYILQLILHQNFFNPKNTTYVCEKCNTLKTDDGIYNCKCGGTFLNIKKMKWTEDEK